MQISEASYGLQRGMLKKLNVPLNTLCEHATIAVPNELFWYENTTVATTSYRGWNPINYYDLYGKRMFAPADYILKKVGMSVDQFMIYMTNMTCSNITLDYWYFDGKYYAEHKFCGTYDKHIQNRRFGGSKQILIELLPNKYMLEHSREFEKRVTVEDIKKNSLAGCHTLVEDSYRILDAGMPLCEFLGGKDREKVFNTVFGSQKWKDYMEE